MGIKKIARPMNKAKNAFVEWLKDNDAECIDVFEGESTPNDGWDYYRTTSGFVHNILYTGAFMVWQGTERIEYSDETVRYNDLSISEFTDLIK